MKGTAYSDILYLYKQVSNLASCDNFHTKFFVPFKNNLRMKIKIKRCDVWQEAKRNVKCSPGTKVFKFFEAAIQVSDFDLPDR